MRLARRRDLVQRAARKAAAERRIDRRHAERQAAGVFQAGRSLERPQALAQLVDHH